MSNAIGTDCSERFLMKDARDVRAKLWLSGGLNADEVLPAEFFFVSAMLDRRVEVLCGCAAFGTPVLSFSPVV